MFDKKSKFFLSIDAAEEAGERLFLNSSQSEQNEWRKEEEGQLSLDVAQTETELYIIATMSGTNPERVELHLHNDLLTIRGFRRSSIPAEAEFLISECYWGKFSRTVVLPVEVKAELARAEYKHGILTVILPKAEADKKIPIFVVEE